MNYELIRGGDQLRIKKVIFKNYYGEEMTFTRHFPLYIEKINTFGVSGRFMSDNLIGSPGIYTSSFEDSGKTITAEFAFWNRYGDTQTLKKIERVFTPLKTGLLTVFDTDNMIYRIEAYPTAMPSYNQSGKVIKWTVNFQADYPYWRKGYEMISKVCSVGHDTIIYNPCMMPVPVEIVFPVCSEKRSFSIVYQHTNFLIKPVGSDIGDVIVSTRDFSVRKVSDGSPVSNSILSAEIDIGDIMLMPGSNTIRMTRRLNNFVYPDSIVRFWELTAGVI